MLTNEDMNTYYALFSRIGEIAYYIVCKDMKCSKSLRRHGNREYFKIIRNKRNKERKVQKIAAIKGFQGALQNNALDVNSAMRKWRYTVEELKRDFMFFTIIIAAYK